MFSRHQRSISALREEQGSMTLLMTALIVVTLIAILPLVWNVGAVRAIGRESHNAADAAALAAAESVARRLNQLGYDWWGCIPPETRPLIVRRYLSMAVAPVAASQLGGGAAAQYAAANRGTLTSYAQRLRGMGADGVHAKLVSGVVIPPVVTDARTDAYVRGLLARSLYPHEGMPVAERATAEAYLHQVRSWQTPCPGNPKAIAQHYRFRWRVRLVPVGW